MPSKQVTACSPNIARWPLRDEGCCRCYYAAVSVSQGVTLEVKKYLADTQIAHVRCLLKSSRKSCHNCADFEKQSCHRVWLLECPGELMKSVAQPVGDSSRYSCIIDQRQYERLSCPLPAVRSGVQCTHTHTQIHTFQKYLKVPHSK